MSESSPERPILIFDGDCAFCTTSARWLQRRLVRRVGSPVSDSGGQVRASRWRRNGLDVFPSWPFLRYREVRAWAPVAQRDSRHGALGGAVPVEPWQFTDLAAYGTTAERAQYEVLWVDRAGQISGGAQAFAQWLIHSGGFWRPLGVMVTLPPIRWIAAGIYRLIANNREKMPGGTPACALPPQETQ